MRHVGAAAVVMALVLGTGCATASAPRQAPNGEGWSVDPEGRGLHGQASGAPVALQWEGSRIQGTYRSLPVMLEVAPDLGGHVVAGEWEGGEAALRFSADQVEGMLGACAVNVRRQPDGAFRGGRTCGMGRAEPLAVTLPSAVWTRSAPERAAWIALTLAEARGGEARSLAGPGHAGVVTSQFKERPRSHKCNTRAMGE